MADVTYKSVRKEFGEVVALKDFSLQIPDGEFVVLVGPSGSGQDDGPAPVGGARGDQRRARSASASAS